MKYVQNFLNYCRNILYTKLTYCIIQYQVARCVWREFGACRFLRIRTGPMIVCNHSSSKGRKKKLCGVTVCNNGFLSVRRHVITCFIIVLISRSEGD